MTRPWALACFRVLRFVVVLVRRAHRPWPVSTEERDDVLPRQILQSSVQGLLMALDDEHVVTTPAKRCGAGSLSVRAPCTAGRVRPLQTYNLPKTQAKPRLPASHS